MQEQIKNIKTLEDLQALYTATFGKNGTMTLRLKEMKNLDIYANEEIRKKNILDYMFEFMDILINEQKLL